MQQARVLRILFLLGFLVLIGVIGKSVFADSNGSDRYVSPSGANNSNCSQQNPCKTIDYAIGQSRPGDSIVVAHGTYGGFDVRRSGITIRATNPKDASTWPEIRDTKRRDIVQLEGASNVVLSGIKIYGTGKNKRGLYLYKASNVLVQNCDIGNNEDFGINTNVVSKITVDNCKVHDSKVQHGIYFGQVAEDITITNNEIYNNASQGIHVNYEGAPGRKFIKNVTIKNNLIHHNGKDPYWGGDRGSEPGGRKGPGIRLNGVNNAIVANNVLVANWGGILIPDANDTKVYHNTVLMPKAEAGKRGWFVIQLEGEQGNVAYNNIFYHPDPQSDQYAKIENTVKADYNVYYKNVPNGESSHSFAVDNLDSLISLYQDNESGAKVSYSYDSLPTLSLEGVYWQLSDDSKLLDAGTTLTSTDIKEDAYGNKRDTKPDIGSFEDCT